MIKQSRTLFFWLAFLVLSLFLMAAAIKFAVENSGNYFVELIEDHAVPYVLKTDDVEMGCIMAESLTLLVPSLAEINASPHKLAVILDFLSGSCAEFKAWEEELRYLRAVYEKNVREAQDARIAQKRYLNLAAKRQLNGYLNLEAAYSETSNDECPIFDSWNDEFYWLVGLMDGLQAVLNDLASEGSANVPLDISLKVGRGAHCLNNEKWWGLPNAIKVAIWLSFPESTPKNIDPLTVLDLSVQTGMNKGVRIAQVIAAKIYIGLGNTEQVKVIIRDNVLTRNEKPVNTQFLFLDQVVILQLQAISDAMWTEATGKRTPIRGLGTFWDDNKNPIDTIDILDVL